MVNIFNDVFNFLMRYGIIEVITVVITALAIVVTITNEVAHSRNKKATKARVEEIFKSDKEKTILEHLEYNIENISNIYNWSQTQAKISFGFAIVFCFLGFILIAISIGLIFETNIATEEKISAAIISAAGGAVTELISTTIFLVYRTSLKQLSHYHDYLHEDERFLSCINLLDNFCDEKNYDEMLKEVIRSEINLNLIRESNKARENNKK